MTLRLEINGVDFTSFWRPYESRWTMRAWNGEAFASSFVLDDDGTISHADLAARKIVEVWENASGSDICLYRGRVSNKHLGQGPSQVHNDMRWVVEAEDCNVELRGIRVNNAVRPSETDEVRFEAIRLAFLNGAASTHADARDSTDMGNTWLGQGVAVNLEAETYTDTDPMGVFNRIVEVSGRTYFVTLNDDGTMELYYGNHTDESYASDIEITDAGFADNADDIDIYAAYRGPNAGEHNGQRVLTGGAVRWGDGNLYEDSDIGGAEAVYDKWEETFTNEWVQHVTQADNILNKLVGLSDEDFTYIATIDMQPQHVHRLRAGMMVLLTRFRANKPTQGYVRCVQMQVEPVLLEDAGNPIYRVNLDLGRAQGRRLIPRGRTKPGPYPPSMDQISTPNSGFELGNDTNWTPGAIGSMGVVGPATGDWEGSWYYNINGATSMIYEGLTGTSFTAGTTYVFRAKAYQANSTTFLRVTDLTASADYASVSIGSPSTWTEFCLEWTPVSTVAGIRVAFASDSGLDNFSLDDLRVYTGASGDTTEPVGETGSGSAGDDSDTFAPIDHVHEHGDLTGAHQYHDADQVSIDDSGAYFTGTSVEAALQEIGAGGIGGSIEVAEADGAPDVSGVTRIEFDGPSVTNDGGGQVTVTAAAASHAHGSPAAGFRGVLVQRTTNFTTIDDNDNNPDFDTELYDTDGLWTAGAPERITIPASWNGLHAVFHVHGGFATGTDGFAEFKLYKNIAAGSIGLVNDDKLVGVSQHFPSSSYNTFIELVTPPLQVATGDFFVLAIKTPNTDSAIEYHDISITMGAYLVEPGEGAQGDPGEGVPTGGTAGQVLTKDSGTDFDTSWQDAAEGGARILLADGRSTPFTFNDLLQADDGSDFLWTD
jgi:hypothetical protein